MGVKANFMHDWTAFGITRVVAVSIVHCIGLAIFVKFDNDKIRIDIF